MRRRRRARPVSSLSIDLAAFARQVLRPGELIFAAASGGGDSTAMCWLLAEVARQQGRRLIACVIDHALRDGSAADALRARDNLSRIGAETIVRRLDWPFGPKASQEAARRARYAALAEHARDLGCGVVFLGHTWNDQAETTFMRREAGSGARGLAAMAALSPCPVWPEGRALALARPLLGVRRAALRAVLNDAGVSWLEDPANALDRYARVRARRGLGQLGGSGALVAQAEAAAKEAEALDAAAAELLASQVRLGDFEAEALFAPTAGDPVQIRLLQALACSYGAAEREPSPGSASRILARLAEGGGGGLAGACLNPRRAGNGAVVRIARDPGGVNGRRGGGAALPDLELEPGRETVWDGRLLLQASGRGWVVQGGSGRGAPDISPGAGRLESRWIAADRVRRLLWRAQGWKNAG